MIRKPPGLVSGLALGAALMLLTACGSTVRLGSLDQAEAGLDGGLGIPSASDGASRPSTGSVDGGATGPSGPALATTTGSQTPGDNGYGASAGIEPTSVAGISGRGFTATTITIGVTTQNDTKTYSAALGFGGLDFGDYDAMVTAIANDMNSKGGLGGRKIILARHDIKTADVQSDPNTTAQAACAYFTQDTKVAAVINPVAGIDGDILYRCLQKANVPLFSMGLSITTKKQLSGYGQIYKLIAPFADEWVPTLVQRLQEQHYFTPWDVRNKRAGVGKPSIGLVYADEEPTRTVFVNLKRLLSSRGYTVTTSAYSPSSAGQAQVQSTALRFNSLGVTHVIPDNAGSALLFMLTAGSQNYHPRYGLTSAMAPLVLAQNAGSEMIGMLGIGWLPGLDVAAAQDPGPLSSADATCSAIMHQAGVDVSSRPADTVSSAFCDAFDALHDAVLLGGPTPAAIAHGLSLEATRFAPAATFSGYVTPQHPLLPTAVRDIAYSYGCKCVVYVSKTNHPLLD